MFITQQLKFRYKTDISARREMIYTVDDIVPCSGRSRYDADSITDTVCRHIRRSVDSYRGGRDEVPTGYLARDLRLRSKEIKNDSVRHFVSTLADKLRVLCEEEAKKKKEKKTGKKSKTAFGTKPHKNGNGS